MFICIWRFDSWFLCWFRYNLRFIIRALLMLICACFIRSPLHLTIRLFLRHIVYLFATNHKLWFTTFILIIFQRFNFASSTRQSTRSALSFTIVIFHIIPSFSASPSIVLHIDSGFIACLFIWCGKLFWNYGGRLIS